MTPLSLTDVAILVGLNLGLALLARLAEAIRR